MSSKYDNIKTASELIYEVKMHGLSTLQEDICRAQDIFGNTSVGELERLANDNGRNNSKEEPDPEGTWNSGKDGVQKVFYRIIFTIWGWERAIDYWNRISNPEMKHLKQVESESKVQEDKIRSLVAENQMMEDDLYFARQSEMEAEKATAAALVELEELKAKLEAEKLETMKLKAKLYDLLG